MTDIVNGSQRAARVVFWDFDGTLAFRKDRWTGALLDALRHADPTTTITVQQLRPHLSTGFPWHSPEVSSPPKTASQWWDALQPTLRRAYSLARVPDEIAEVAISRVATEFYRPDAWTVIDGATKALAATRDAGYRNVILSNHGPELPELVEALGLGTHITSTITSAAIGAEKPNRRIFEHALAVTHAGDDTWMVGDNPDADISGAQHVGIRAILTDAIYPPSVGSTLLQAAAQIVRTGAPRTEI